ncbi:hypothetical protein BCT31_11090 [Vibrio lentus]|nr:hypothetical protein BCU96_23040 [Vibrio lentus]PMH15471.1 hypothetical protein BCU76_13245 [Vibrio lentus]PMJ06718.1 hypothetical protein BCU30_09700 [Vibrio lentus]PMK87799.1 hypothetical protein BCT89_06570 [Vibrio lentus]PMN14832.1 hypothetical protein BCT39_08485 [Vibrio lentus]
MICFFLISDGEFVQEATYKLVVQTNASFEGTLDNTSKASVGGVAPANLTLTMVKIVLDSCQTCHGIMNHQDNKIEKRTLKVGK